jgi:hypothetical protein
MYMHRLGSDVMYDFINIYEKIKENIGEWKWQNFIRLILKRLSLYKKFLK